MIDSIRVCNVATYAQQPPQPLNNLKKVNYIYGPNGAGKTTISRIVHEPGHTDYQDCQINWQRNRHLKSLVYNRDFVDRIFRQEDDLPGIFTLGEESAEIAQKISDCQKKQSDLNKEMQRLQITLEGNDCQGGKRADLENIEVRLREDCWSAKHQLPSLQEALRGNLNNKRNFCEQVKSQQKSNNANLKELPDLEKRVRTLLEQTPQTVDQLPSLPLDSLPQYETATILQKHIIGKKDVDIAALITTLGNSDWVKQGQDYLASSDGQCPFCQQQIPDGLFDNLSQYFDKTYANDKATLQKLVSDYNREAGDLVGKIGLIVEQPPSQLDVESLAQKKETLAAILKSNQERLSIKSREPSREVTLESTATVLTEIAALIQSANDEIDRHNNQVKNLAQETKALQSECWRFLLEQLRPTLNQYDKEAADVNTAIESLERQIREKDEEIRRTEAEITKLEQQTTSVAPTIAKINNILKLFSFENFTIAQAEKPHFYKLVRENGTDAKHTLSEGERSFITFLYFYHLVYGSPGNAGVQEDRVVVFDDPVSSLDSDVLFAVSSLIRKIRDDIMENNCHIKQLFVLTHNTYFHKEVTLDSHRSRGKAQNHETFWTVHKCGGISQIKHHDINPVKTGYERLWEELNSDPGNVTSVQNSMRKILEHYFKLLGNIDLLNNLTDHFKGDELQICRSLVSWLHDGSHSVFETPEYEVNQSQIDRFRNVFRRIFEETDHRAHYNMMSRPYVQASSVHGITPPSM